MFKKILGISMCMICLGFSNVSAEVVTIEGDGECPLGVNMTLSEARKIALEYALDDVNLKASVRIKAYSKMIDHMIDKDVVEMICDNVVKVKDAKFSSKAIDDSLSIIVKCHIVADVNDDYIWEQDQQLRTPSKNSEGIGKIVVSNDLVSSLNILKERAKARALKNVQRKAVLFVRNIASVQLLTDDEIATAIANSIEIQGEPEYKIEEIGDAIQITCKLNAIIDDSLILDAFKDREHLTEATRKYKELESKQQINEQEFDELNEKYRH